MNSAKYKRPRTDSYSANTWRRKLTADKGSGYGTYGNLTMPSWRQELDSREREISSNTVDFSDPFSISNMHEDLDSGKYGSVSKEIEELTAQRDELMNLLYAMDPSLRYKYFNEKKNLSAVASKADKPAPVDVIDLEDENWVDATPAQQPVSVSSRPLVVLDSDDEDPITFHPYQHIVLGKPAGNSLMQDFMEAGHAQSQNLEEGDAIVAGDTEREDYRGEYVGVDDDTLEESNEEVDPDMSNLWTEMAFGLESSKDTAVDTLSNGDSLEDQEDCAHSFILKDDIGYVCRVCGIIQRSIETIIEYQYPKSTRSIRTYWHEGRTKDADPVEGPSEEIKFSAQDFSVAEIIVHPRHRKQMKPHQIEGFNFLVSNLLAEDPGGCIMAHAPGSGKTFMIISFLQSFMAKYPHARPLVVLPRGIVATWKKEFERWQVEDNPLYDFYSVKADGRSQQLEVLQQWAAQRSILFLGYKQFSSIVCDNDTGRVATKCQEILLQCPSILILDEGHTPRNQDTDILTSLEKVQTARKVVLSGTLYQNHVKEVFNILNLVRPKFLKMEYTRAIKRRILSRAQIRHNSRIGGDAFYEIVEHTLLKGEKSQKVTLIHDLREMTSKVLHYYKGDFLDELPGLVDFTVLLKLSPRQKSDVSELKNLTRKFKISSEGSAIYVHPQLKTLSKKCEPKGRVDVERIDAILKNLDEREGVKAKFYLSLLQLCESNNEKLLVFSQYLLPLKFLERLTAKVKGYRLGKEMFTITGDSDTEMREISMETFNSSPDARVFFGSIKACGEGISLVGASRIIVLDVHLNPSVTRQAIGRAFRPGQLRKVYTYRLVASGSPEEEDHATCFRKESIAKMWFEWNEFYGQRNFEMESVAVHDSGDLFMESPRLNEDVIAVYKR